MSGPVLLMRMGISRIAQRGFTLIEISVVLIIIGLIVGGIITGKALIRSARLLSVMGDEQTYVHAVENFRQKYASLPGDMTNAVSYWGAAGGNAGDNYTASCYGYQGTGTQTCNGNGNGQYGGPPCQDHFLPSIS